MEENISERNGFVRLALGTGLTACGIAHLSKESGNRGIGALFVAAGAMKVAEGIFLYCPVKALINSNVKEAVATSFNDYLDGDHLMSAYNDFYTEKWGTGASDSSGGQSNTGSSIEKAANDIGQIVSNTTQNDSLKNTASQAVKTAAGAGSGKNTHSSK
ncbi:YgaP family membrane protein [Ureibacillus chungkukjangi]|uniref:Inner membrane protein YgaP-like transmembrane domain-containing protein n=1 Tax=Ureibacillus chungkukjangi TaxID=1202712 RepID=A0A318TKB5_9BACL|nr:DUF2892 domain-containing protein [Ureibacillus chungkukjangi]MCM3389399.1 DUF2892 domain-containing protein [Ureibacillus chungkukjangi]PYF05166.1 hypothetical protein BJ095_11940 [Ureibacillus chungkukjangi]HCG4535956.1 DUF2892 domain-containing protein [Salmonella enterica subsp. enterica serovar Typhi str. AG3]